MARGHGRILTSIWEDADFLALAQPEQRLYLFLISQPNLNHAGLLPLTLRRWARKAAGLTATELEKHLQALADAISLPVGLLLEEAGIVSPGLLTGTPPPASGPVTVAEVAASLGITKPLNVKLLEAITATLLADQATP